jgi:hypothetical protein
MQLNCRHSLGPLCGAVTLAALVAASALHAGFGQKTADAAGGESVLPGFAYDLPNLPGQKMTGVLVEYAPGRVRRGEPGIVHAGRPRLNSAGPCLSTPPGHGRVGHSEILESAS